MLPEWGRFMTAVKLNRGLRDSNYDQLYSYLKQHETHAKENKMILKRFSQPTVDPLALLSNVSNPQHYSPSSSASSSTQVPLPLTESSSPAEDLIENLTNTLACSLNHTEPSSLKPTINSEHHPMQRTKPQYKMTEVGNVNQGQARPGQARTVKCYNCNGTGHIARNCTQPKRPQNSEYFKDKMLLMQAKENGVALDAEQLLFLASGQDNVFNDDVDVQPVQDLALNVDNVFQADDCDAFDFDVDEAPTAQTMFMANLSSADPVTDKAGPSYDSDILSEVPDYEHYLDAAFAHLKGHVTHDNIQLDHFVDSHADYTSDSHMIPYDQYVRDNEVPVVHSGASSVPTDAFMMIYNDMCESHDPSISNTSRNTVGKNSLTAELATYKEHVELYEQRAKFELTEREQKINEQLRIVISDHNFKEETLKRELHSIKLQLASTINHNKSMVEEVKISPHDYSKENLLAIFTPQKQLTPEQIFWSSDLMKLKSKALKERTKVSRPIKAFTVITPTGLTEGEQGFEQTKACYLQEVIPFFKTLKDNFEGIQKALTREAKEMKDVFEELEAEVAQYAIDRKHYAIELKNLLIANDNLIAECLSQKVFCVATNSELNVAQFTEMHVANTTSEARCLALKAKLANLCDTNNHDNQKELINHFSKLEGKDNVIRQLKKQLSLLQVTHSDTDRTLRVQTIDSQITKLTNQVTHLQAQNDLFRAENDKIKHHYKELYDSIKITRAKHIEQVVHIVLWYLDSGCSKHMAGNRLRLMNFVKKFIGIVRFRNDHFGAIMGYGDYVIGNSVISKVYCMEGLGHNLFFVGQFCDSDLEVAFRKHSCYVRDTNGVELIKGSRGSNLYTISIEDMMKSSPICLLSKASKNKSWLWHRRLNHLNFGTINDLARKDLVRGLPRLKFENDHLCSACQLGKSKKHTHKPKAKNNNLEVLNTFHIDLCGLMRVQTINGKKYILVIVDDYSRFTWVKFLRSKDETLDVVIKFITQIQVGLNKTVRYVCIDNGTEFVNYTMTEYYERIGIFHQKTVPRTPQQNGVVERRNRTLVEAARTMLIFSKALMFLWAEAVATACYTQNRSLIHTRHHKTRYELVHNKKPDLTFFRVFGALCFPQTTAKISESFNQQLILEYLLVMHQARKGLAPNFLTPGQISSGLVPNLVPATPYATPTNKELEIMFQPMFDEYLEPPRAERPVPPAQAEQAPVNSAGTPLSNTIDQDAPTPSSSALQSHSLHQGIAAKPNYMEERTNASIDNPPFVNVFAPEPHSEATSSGDVSLTDSPYVSQTLHHLNKWSKDHPLDNVIGNPSRSNSFDYPPDSYHPLHLTYETYSGDSRGNDSHFGYDCSPQFSFNYEPELGYIQNYNSYPHDSLSFPQQYPCCEDCENLKDKQLEEEQATKAQRWKLPVCYDDDDDEESSNSLEDNIIFELLSYSAVIPSEPIDSLSMEDEHLNTISATKSDEFIKSCIENLVPNPKIIPMEIDQHSFNAESDLIESMPNHDSSITISSKIDSLFDEFADKLTLLTSILPGFDETDCHPEKETRFAKRLLYDNSSPRPPEEIVSDNSNADIESFSPSPIPNKDSDSHMEEIDLPFTPDDPTPPSIKDDDYDSGRDIPILEELLDNYSLSLPANESYHFDIPSPYRPPAKPPHGNTGTLNIKMLGDVSDQKVPIPNLTITRILNQEKSPNLLSHQGFEAF
nr:retrovirus-related Pol polyprotein from transposon TNT 1-94 [Tanacetum cinerariifolium]